MKIKETIGRALAKRDYEGLADLAREHGGKITNGLMAFLAETDEQKKWPAVMALGIVTARLYDLDPEKAKRVLRQLIWNLNEESGGIGWGIPEAFGEILARVPALKNDYACLLVAYISKGPCYIENELLQEGVLWGLGRSGWIEERLKKDALPFFQKALKNKNSALRGTAVWASGEIGAKETVPLLKTLQRENEMIKLFVNENIQEKPLSQWVEESLKKLNQGGE